MAYLVEEDEEETMKIISGGGGGGGGASSSSSSSSSSNVNVMTLNQIAGFLVHFFTSKKKKSHVVQI